MNWLGQDLGTEDHPHGQQHDVAGHEHGCAQIKPVDRQMDQGKCNSSGCSSNHGTQRGIEPLKKLVSSFAWPPLRSVRQRIQLRDQNSRLGPFSSASRKRPSTVAKLVGTIGLYSGSIMSWLIVESTNSGFKAANRLSVCPT